MLISNRGFSDWGQVFADQVVATAIVDRLIDNAIVINIRGRSYRIRGHQDSTNGKRRARKPQDASGADGPSVPVPA